MLQKQERYLKTSKNSLNASLSIFVHVMTYYLHGAVGYVRLGLLFQVKKVANIMDTNMSHCSFRHRSLAISNKFVIIMDK